MMLALRAAPVHRRTLLHTVLVAVSCLWCSLAGAADETRAVGEAAPPFTLSTLEGKKYSLEARLKSRAVLVAFLSAPCKPCEESIADLVDLCERHRADGKLEVAGIVLKGTDILKRSIGDGGPDSNLSLMEELAEDERFITADAYGVIATPTFFLVGKDGKVLWKHIGRLRAEKADPEIERLLKP